ncbi:MAG TPA: hypothetical protein VJ725_34595 [Thermoanaerobaculia bacterium]|nr:hypothetical protein [Thermoanaerobaculia bacterium]
MNRSRILNWGIFAFALLLLLPGLALAQGNGNGNNNRQQLNPQPVLIYTVSGGTLAGQTFETLIVYSNGMAIWTSSGEGTGGTGGTSDGIQTVQLSQRQINALLRDLRRTGAFRGNQINTGNGGDDTLPMVTITVFFNPTGSGRSLAQTFSFFDTSGSRGRVNNVITNFINNNFGDGSGSGTGQ